MKASLYEAPHPLQPLLRHESGGRKFHPNTIVVALMDDYGADRLSLLQDPSYSLEDRAHLAQLLGAFENELEAWGLASVLPAKRRTRPTRSKPPLQPVQPLAIDPKGVLRFKENPLVNLLLNDSTKRKSIDLNRICMMDFPGDDFNQLAQLIGYSHSGAPRYLYTRCWNVAAREWEDRKHRIVIEAAQEKVDHFDQTLPAPAVGTVPKPRF